MSKKSWDIRWLSGEEYLKSNGEKRAMDLSRYQPKEFVLTLPPQGTQLQAMRSRLCQLIQQYNLLVDFDADHFTKEEEGASIAIASVRNEISECLRAIAKLGEQSDD